LIYERWRKELVECLAHTEARIDFGEDEIGDESLAEGEELHMEARRCLFLISPV